MGRLDGKVAVITGGASGIGEGTVRLFHKEGAKVVISDVQDALGEALVSELGKGVVYQHTDVRDEDQVAAMIQRAVDEFGGLDILFNNAGFGGTFGPIEDTPRDEYQITMDILVAGVVYGIKHAVKPMKARGGGSIISTGSVAGLSGGFGPHIYSAAKAAVVHLTKSVSIELGESFIRVNAICPGGILTPLAATNFGKGPEGYERAKKGLAEWQPVPRAGMPEDIANMALFLASDESTFVTGQAIAVDGAIVAGRKWSELPPVLRSHKPMRVPGQARPKT